MTSIARRTALALVVATWVTTANAADWVAEPIDTRWLAGGFKSGLALEPLGRPAVAYGTDMLHYAVFDGTSWIEEIVRDQRCSGTSINLAFDGAGDPVIAYVAGQGWMDGTLEVARRRAGVWTVETLATTAFEDAAKGADNALAIDPGGHPAVAYVHPSTLDVVLARWDGGAWFFESIAASVSMGQARLSLAFDSAGNPAIASSGYSDGVRILRWDGLGWITEGPPSPGRPIHRFADCALAFDATGEPALLYFSGYSVDFARRRAGVWEIDHILDGVDSIGMNSPLALVFDRTDNPIIGYSDYNESERKIKSYIDRKLGPTWERLGGRHAMQEITLDAAGNLINLYSERPAAPGYPDPRIGVRTWNGSGWSDNPLADGVPVEPQLAFAVHPTTGAAIAAFGGQWAGRWDGGSWTYESIGSWSTGLWPYPEVPAAAAFDPSTGQPALAVVSNGQLRFKRWTGAEWTDDLVSPDANGLVSLAFDGRGNPWVSFYARSGLSSAYWDGGVWVTSLVHPWFGAESATSIAIGPTGEAIIAYDALGEVRVARRPGTAWTVETLIAGGYHPSLALDDLGRPWISFLRATPTSANLELASWTGTDWVFELVTADFQPRETSLSLGPAGDAAIAFTTNQGLRVATRSAATWTIDPVDVHEGCAPASAPTLQRDITGAMAVAYLGCLQSVRWARDTETHSFDAHRWSIPIVAPSWRENYFPHTPLTDDETAPFPLATALPVSGRDDIPSTDPLTMYRLLNAGEPTGNRLKAVKSGAGVALSY